MRKCWERWLCGWVVWATRRGRTWLPRANTRHLLRVEHLEVRLVPAGPTYFSGGVRVAAGDVTGDGCADIVAAAGPGGAPLVQVFDGRTGEVAWSFDAYAPAFAGGVTVAVGDVTGDGRADVVTGADAGGGPHVRVFDGASRRLVGEFFAYGTDFRGGVRVAVGDVTGDGVGDVITGAGAGGGPHVNVYSGGTLAPVVSFMAGDPDSRGGVTVAAGDVTGDGRAELLAGSGPTVRVFQTAGSIREVRSFPAYDSPFAGVVWVAAGDVTGDGVGDIITGAGAGGPHVRAFDGRSGAEVASWMVYAPDFAGGAYVAAFDLDADGRAEVITGAGAGGGPHVRAVGADGRTELASFFAFDAATPAGGFSRPTSALPPGEPPPSPANVLPTITPTADLTVAVGAAVGPLGFTVGDAETPAAGLVVTAASSNPALLSDDRITLGGTAEGRTILLSPNPGRVGSTTITLTVTDAAGGTATDTFALVVTATPPPGPNTSPTISVVVDQSSDGQVVGPLSFTVGDAETAAPDLVVTAASDNPGLVGVAVGGIGANRTVTLTPTAGQSGTAAVTLTVADADGVTTTETFTLAVTVPVGPPPEPPTSTADFGASSAFLYTGPGAVQTGVAAGTILPLRAAVLRGRTLATDGAPLAGVTVTVLGHPEFGRTATGADGWFDMAVNGGGSLVVKYEKAGFLAVQRTADVPWRDFELVDDVVLTALDASVTTVDLAAATPFQVARGSVQTDADGTRQATLLFPQGVGATMRLANGTTQALTSLDVRATEYTVGDAGPAAMPGTLPPTSAYTYAVELSVDQALAAGATRVDFSRAVPFYVENFLNFPVGMAVPTGYYDRERGVWVASDNGRVVRILAEAGGLADVDGDGDGIADGAAALAALGVTDAERAQLAALYDPGASLWRVPLTHFTPWDCNWPFGPPDGADGPAAGADELGPSKEDDQNEDCGSVIGVENQTLGEVVPIAGTPFSLVYRSDRAPGYTADRTLTIPLTRGTLPAGVKSVELTVEVGGRRFSQSFSPAANLSTAFTWDGADAYGRTLAGGQAATVEVGYVYDGVYNRPANAARSFGLASGGAITGNRTRQEVTLSQSITATVAASDARAVGLGGLTFDVHHSYDPAAQVLHLGSGSDRTVDGTVGSTLFAGSGVRDGTATIPATFQVGGTTWIARGPDGSEYIGTAQNQPVPTHGDAGPAARANLSAPGGIAVGPDGSLYIADTNHSRVRQVTPNGVIRTLEDMFPIVRPDTIAVGPDGSVYFAGSGQPVVYRLAGNGSGRPGRVQPFAGSSVGGSGALGDGGPALAARLVRPAGIAVGADGSVYIADSGDNRVRRVGPDGVITTVAGTGSFGFSGDGGPATAATLNGPTALAVGPDGTLYVADAENARVRRVGANGLITTAAGTGDARHTGDGGLAVQAGLGGPENGLSTFSLAVGPDGLYIGVSDYVLEPGGGRQNYHGVRLVGSDGIITTVAGSGLQEGVDASGGPATRAGIYPQAIAVGPDRALYVADVDIFNDTRDRVLRVTPALLGFRTTDVLLPSEDGTEVYRFTSAGRHLETLDALTGRVVYTFGYDAAGRLASVTDADGNVTTVERDPVRNSAAIVGPFGQRTALGLNTFGYLTTVTNTAGETFALGYGAGGLLTSFTDPNGNRSTLTYDALGRLTRDEDSLTGFTRLTRQDLGGGSYKVTTTNAVGGTRQFSVELLPDGSKRRTSVDGRGFATVTLIGTDGTERTTTPDGTVTTTTYGPDPRYGLLAPVVTGQTVTTPGGLTSAVTGSRTATFTTPGSVTSPIATLTDTTVVNGRTFTSVYNAAAGTITSTSAAGRVSTSVLDDRGRVASVTVPGVEPTRYTYDARGRIDTIAQGSRVVTNAYNADGRLSAVTDPLGRTTRFDYDAAGRLVRQTRPDGAATVFEYDAAGNMTALTPPGRPRHTFGYDDEDQLTSTTPPAVGPTDDSTRYVYNLAHQLVREALPGGEIVTYAYCDCGRLTGITAPWGSYTYTYSTTTGELSSLQSPGGFTLAFGYDGGLVTSEALSGPVAGRLDRTFDADFRLASERVNGASAVAFGYDADGLLTQAGALTVARDAATGRVSGTTLGAVTDSLAYNAFGEASEYHARVGGATALRDVYTQDALGRIARKVETVGGATTTTDYGYDLIGQLTTVTENGVVVQRYAYDANGNRLSLTTPGGTTAGTYDAQDRLLTYGTKTYSYDPNGALDRVTDSATGEATTYAYDAFENLTRVELPDGRVIEYLIDGQNRRVGKKIDGVLTEGLLYASQLRPAAALDAAGNVTARFVYATGINVPAYMVKAGVTYRLVTDHLGSVRLVVNIATGAVAQRLDYDAFGRVTRDTNPGFQPFGYAGGLYDADTGLVRFGARDYDAETGRWTAKDPIGLVGGPNLYAYIENAPIDSRDVTGLKPKVKLPAKNWVDLVLGIFTKPEELGEYHDHMGEGFDRNMGQTSEENERDRTFCPTPTPSRTPTSTPTPRPTPTYTPIPPREPRSAYELEVFGYDHPAPTPKPFPTLPSDQHL